MKRMQLKKIQKKIWKILFLFQSFSFVFSSLSSKFYDGQVLEVIRKLKQEEYTRVIRFIRIRKNREAHGGKNNNTMICTPADTYIDETQQPTCVLVLEPIIASSDFFLKTSQPLKLFFLCITSRNSVLSKIQPIDSSTSRMLTNTV